jgi:hypothetical protein
MTRAVKRACEDGLVFDFRLGDESFKHVYSNGNALVGNYRLVGTGWGRAFEQAALMKHGSRRRLAALAGLAARIGARERTARRPPP